MKKFQYTARWANPEQNPITSVSFEASSDNRASLRADKIARDLHLIHSPRTIQCWKNGKQIIVEELESARKT
jgi:hypothetical protein